MSDTDLIAETREKKNPFIYNAPVRGKDFFNRTEIIQKMIHETVTGSSQGNVWVSGERQIGKTSLLRYIQSQYECISTEITLYPINESFKVALIYLNVQDITTRDDFYRALGQSLKNFFDFKIKPKARPYDSFINMLTILYSETKNYMVFLIDEFDAFVEHLSGDDPKKATSFLAEFNKLLQGVSEIKNEPKVFGCIMAANSTIEDLVKDNSIDRRGSGLIIEALELEWFNRKQIEELAQAYLKGYSIRFSPEDIDMCFKMTQGYPYFVQKLFAILYEHKSRKLIPGSYLKIVKEEYGKEFIKTIKGWANEKMPGRTREKLKTLGGKILEYAGDFFPKLVVEGFKAFFSS